MKTLVSILLNRDADSRPRVHEILAMPIIKDRIKEFLTKTQHSVEFNHTIIHKKDLNQIYHEENVKILKLEPSEKRESDKSDKSENNLELLHNEIENGLKKQQELQQQQLQQRSKDILEKEKQEDERKKEEIKRKDYENKLLENKQKNVINNNNIYNNNNNVNEIVNSNKLRQDTRNNLKTEPKKEVNN